MKVLFLGEIIHILTKMNAKILQGILERQQMRVDKFINSVNITKRRTIAEDMCKSKVVSVNGTVAKPAKDVKPGDIIEIAYLDRTVRYEVLQIPVTKSIPKSKKEEYVKEL